MGYIATAVQYLSNMSLQWCVIYLEFNDNQSLYMKDNSITLCQLSIHIV